MCVTITPDTSLAERLRQIVYDAQGKNDGAQVVPVDVNLLLDLANVIDTRDQNLLHLLAALSSRALDANERKTTPVATLASYLSLMEAASRAIAGFPIWSSRHTPSIVQARCEAVREAISNRLRKFGNME